MQRPFFVIFGGMGTLASHSLVTTLNQVVQAHNDQDFLDYVLFNDAGTPDRTNYIVDPTAPNPLPTLLDNVEKAQALGAQFIVLNCNTAHHFYDELQAHSAVEILHMPRISLNWAQRKLSQSQYQQLVLLGTRGSVTSGVYQRCARELGYELVYPNETLQQAIDQLIYDDVKGGRGPNPDRFAKALVQALSPENHRDPQPIPPSRSRALILGCTELSLLHRLYGTSLPVIDAQDTLIEEILVRTGKQARPE